MAYAKATVDAHRKGEPMLITKNDVIVELLCNIENALAQAKEAEEKLRELLEKAQLSQEGTTSDTISRKAVKYKITALVNEFEEILAHIREREVDDSVCGLCEYDGAYIGQSGDWCNECPGFNKDDCFKLKDKYREEWLSING